MKYTLGNRRSCGVLWCCGYRKQGNREGHNKVLSLNIMKKYITLRSISIRHTFTLSPSWGKKTHRPFRCRLQIQRPSAVALLQAGATSAEAEREIQKWSPAHHTSIGYVWFFGFWLRNPLKGTPVELWNLSAFQLVFTIYSEGCQGW